MGDLTGASVGRRICLVGWGTAATLHTHVYLVERHTATLTIARSEKNARGVRRFRTTDGRSIPRDDWGGTTAALTCQKKEA